MKYIKYLFTGILICILFCQTGYATLKTRYNPETKQYEKVPDIKDRYQYSEKKTNYDRIKDGELQGNDSTEIQLYYLVDLIELMKSISGKLEDIKDNQQRAMEIYQKQSEMQRVTQEIILKQLGIEEKKEEEDDYYYSS